MSNFQKRVYFIINGVFISQKFACGKFYHEDLEKRGGGGVMAHERNESHVFHKRPVTCERHPLKSPRFSRSSWCQKIICNQESLLTYFFVLGSKGNKKFVCKDYFFSYFIYNFFKRWYVYELSDSIKVYNLREPTGFYLEQFVFLL